MQNLANSSTIFFEPRLATSEKKPEKRRSEFHFQLSNELQASLDLQKILAHFFQVVSAHTSVCGIEYAYDNLNENICFGHKRAHSAKYTLNVEEERIGQLCFYAQSKLDESELQNLETFLGLLVTPLRNALRYKAAIEQSLTDKLTGVGNRAAMDSALRRELSLTQRHANPLSILIIDIDFFKEVNDKFGHLCGDQVLAETARSLKTTLREADQIFRYGGEEFVILLGDTLHEDALAIAERIRLTICNKKTMTPSSSLEITVSVGVATATGLQSSDEILQQADQALYAAKNKGRNRIESAEKLAVTSLPNALKNDAIRQPI